MAKSNGKSRRGFAAMVRNDPEEQRRIASAGGRAAHQKGTAHEFTSEEARIAGSKGGRAGRGSKGRGRGDRSNNSGDVSYDEMEDVE